MNAFHVTLLKRAHMYMDLIVYMDDWVACGAVSALAAD